MGNTKLGFMNVPNGDAIAFDMKESEINPSVVYLSHDDGCLLYTSQVWTVIQ